MINLKIRNRENNPVGGKWLTHPDEINRLGGDKVKEIIKRINKHDANRTNTINKLGDVVYNWCKKNNYILEKLTSLHVEENKAYFNFDVFKINLKDSQEINKTLKVTLIIELE